MLISNTKQINTLRALLDFSPVASAISRLSDGVFLEANEPFFRLHGYSRDEVIGRNSTELMIWHNQSARNQLLETLTKEGEVNNVYVQWQNKSGNTGAALLKARIIQIDDEPCMIGYLTDARELNKQQKQIIEDNFFYSTLFNEHLSGIAVCQMRFNENKPIDFKYLKVNPAFEKLTGLRNVTNHWVSEILPGIRENSPDLFNIYARVSLGNGPESFEYYVELLKIWIEVMVFSHQPEQFVAVFNVITKFKVVEQELRDQKEKLSLVLSASKLGTWDSDRTTGRIIFNKRMCEIIGLTEEERIYPVEAWLDLLHPEDRPKTISAIKEHESGNTPIYQSEFRLHHKEGYWVWILARGQFVARDKLGHPLRMIGTAMDISGAKTLAHDGAEMLRRIESLVKDLEAPKETVSRAIPIQDKLTKRQREVLILIAHGNKSAEIAKMLGIGASTVITHRRSLMKILGLHNAADLTRFAVKNALMNE